MRIICDACDSAPAVLFCAADEAALCRPCDEKVHMCNKLASRHVRVGLANPNEVPRCDICESAPGISSRSIYCITFACTLRGLCISSKLYAAFFYCEIDGSSLCLQCDMIVHVGGKRTHGRYLLLRQRVAFPGDHQGHVEDLTLAMQPKNQLKADNNQAPKMMVKDTLQNHNVSSDIALVTNGEADVDTKMIDLNARPVRSQGQTSNTQAPITDLSNGDNHDGAGVVPVVTCERETGK